MCKRKRAAKVTARMSARKSDAAIGIVPQAVLTYPFNSKGRQTIRIAARMRCRWHATIRLRVKKYGTHRWCAIFGRKIQFVRGPLEIEDTKAGVDRPGVLCYATGSSSPFVVPFNRLTIPGDHTRAVRQEIDVEVASERVYWEDGMRVGSNPRTLTESWLETQGHRLGEGSLQAAESTYMARQMVTVEESFTTHEWHRVRDDCSIETSRSVESPGREWYRRVGLFPSLPKPGSRAYYETRWAHAAKGLPLPPMGAPFVQRVSNPILDQYVNPPKVPSSLPMVNWQRIAPDPFTEIRRSKVSPGPEWERVPEQNSF